MIDYEVDLPEDIVSHSHEVEAKGYLAGVRVRWANRGVDLVFYDADRLIQEIVDEFNVSNYFVEPGLIVVPKVNKASIESAVRSLAEREFVDFP